MTARGFRHAALNMAAGILWRIPGRFGIVRMLGRHSLRCLVFHDISDAESPFTKGMAVNITPGNLEAALKFVIRYYTLVSLQDILSDADGRNLPERAILVTFDDGYASVLQAAIPLCIEYKVPAVFFLNGAFLDNQRLAPDNLVCYVVNELGIGPINEALRAVGRSDLPTVKTAADVFSCVLPVMSLAERKIFLDTLVQLAGINESHLAEEARLYFTREQLCRLASFGFEIGSHTHSHVHCRSLAPDDFCGEIDNNKAELETITGTQVRSFSVPYGSSTDLGSEVSRHLKLSGHRAVFLSESVANDEATSCVIDRVSVHARTDAALFMEIEVLPRLRGMRNRLSHRFGSIANRNAAECPSISKKRHGVPPASASESIYIGERFNDSQ